MFVTSKQKTTQKMQSKPFNPFNREAAKNGAKLVTRDGSKVLAYFDSEVDIRYPIVALVENDESLTCYTVNGEFYKGEENIYDLFIVSEHSTL